MRIQSNRFEKMSLLWSKVQNFKIQISKVNAEKRRMQRRIERMAHTFFKHQILTTFLTKQDKQKTKQDKNKPKQDKTSQKQGKTRQKQSKTRQNKLILTTFFSLKKVWK